MYEGVGKIARSLLPSSDLLARLSSPSLKQKEQNEPLHPERMQVGFSHSWSWALRLNLFLPLTMWIWGSLRVWGFIPCTVRSCAGVLWHMNDPWVKGSTRDHGRLGVSDQLALEILKTGDILKKKKIWKASKGQDWLEIQREKPIGCLWPGGFGSLGKCCWEGFKGLEWWS